MYNLINFALKSGILGKKIGICGAWSTVGSEPKNHLYKWLFYTLKDIITETSDFYRYANFMQL